MSTLDLLELLSTMVRYIHVEWGEEPRIEMDDSSVELFWDAYYLNIDNRWQAWCVLASEAGNIYMGSDPDAMLHALFELRADDA